MSIRIKIPLIENPIEPTMFALTTTGRIYASEDGGTFIPTDTVIPNFIYTSTQLRAYGPNKMLVWTPGVGPAVEVAITDDNWKSFVFKEFTPERSLGNMLIGLDGGNTIAIYGVGYYIAKTSDNFETITFNNQGNLGYILEDPSNPGTFYAVNGNTGIRKSQDNLENFENAFTTTCVANYGAVNKTDMWFGGYSGSAASVIKLDSARTGYTEYFTPNNSSQVFAMCFGDDDLMIVALLNRQVWTTKDQITWTQATAPIESGDAFVSISYNGIFFTACTFTGQIFNSTDGLDWIRTNAAQTFRQRPSNSAIIT